MCSPIKGDNLCQKGVFMRLKKSISKKINYLIVVSMITLSFFMIVANFIMLYSSLSGNSRIMLSKSCSSLQLELNEQFNLVEQSVKNLYDISEGMRPAVELLKDHEITDAYIEEFRSTAVTIANNTKGALALYYRMNPDITLDGKTGFFYVRSSDSNEFEETAITDLYEYDVNDMEHVGWYYVPVWAGEPVWMDPYYNANINVEIISYVVPIYDGSVLVGIVGIDVDFEALKAKAENIDIYKTCGAVLCSMNNGQIYYSRCDELGDELPYDLYNMMMGNQNSEKTIFQRINGKKYGMNFETLQNHMKLLVYVDENEIFSQGEVSVVISLVGFAVIFALTFMLSIHMIRRIVKPIIDITEASKNYAEGNWDIKVHCDTEDELQELTENISIMADKTKEYINYIRDMARKDVLTGLRNKTDYSLYVDKIKLENEDNHDKYAIAVFDVNNLKVVNDNYGHEKGNELLVAASKFICKYFSHSPVFRIGGDEFVAIVDGADFERCKEIVADFNKYMELSKNSSDIMDVCVACGMAIIEEDANTFDELFEIADKRMYENKKSLKNKDGDRR